MEMGDNLGSRGNVSQPCSLQVVVECYITVGLLLYNFNLKSTDSLSSRFWGRISMMQIFDQIKYFFFCGSKISHGEIAFAGARRISPRIGVRSDVDHNFGIGDPPFWHVISARSTSDRRPDLTRDQRVIQHTHGFPREESVHPVNKMVGPLKTKSRWRFL